MATRSAERTVIRRGSPLEIGMQVDQVDPVDQDSKPKSFRARMIGGAIVMGIAAYIGTTYVDPLTSASFTSFSSLVGAWLGASGSRS